MGPHTDYRLTHLFSEFSAYNPFEIANAISSQAQPESQISQTHEDK